MNIKTCKYVEASEVFKNQDLAWDLFIESDPDCSWGDNNRTMVTADVIVDALENCDADEGDEEKQVKKVVKILRSLPQDMYVDLEN